MSIIGPEPGPPRWRIVATWGAAMGAAMLVVYLFKSPLLTRMIDGMAVAGAAQVMWLYSTGVITGMGKPYDRPYVVRFGIVMGWLSAGLISLYRLRIPLRSEVGAVGQVAPDDLFREFTVILAISATVMHIIVVDPERGLVENLRRALVYLSAGGLVGAVVHVFHRMGS